MSLNNIFSRGFNNKSNKSVYTPPCNIDDYEEEEVSELEVLPTPEITLDSQQEAVVYSTEKTLLLLPEQVQVKQEFLQKESDTLWKHFMFLHITLFLSPLQIWRQKR